MKKLILDTDPGVDDAIALMLLGRSSNIEILAITTVAGNSTIQNTTSNATYLKQLLKLSCPIYSGADSALLQPFTTANVHGSDGLSNIKHGTACELTHNASSKIIELVNAHPQEISILCLGPLTNLATAIQTDPTLPSKIKEIVIMGGTYLSHGNFSVVAEFNFGLDPEAAKIIFETTTPKTLIPLDICYKTPLFLSDLELFSHSPLYGTLRDLIVPYIKSLKTFEGVDGAVIYDALAAYYLINDQAFSLQSFEVNIETKGEYTRGMSVIDRRPWGKSTPNTDITLDIDRSSLVQDMIKILG